MVLLGLGFLAAAPATDAQQPEDLPDRRPGGRFRVRRAVYLDAFRQGLRDLGYVEGKNIVIESRWAEGRYDRLSSLAAELIKPRWTSS